MQIEPIKQCDGKGGGKAEGKQKKNSKATVKRRKLMCDSKKVKRKQEDSVLQ